MAATSGSVSAGGEPAGQGVDGAGAGAAEAPQGHSESAAGAEMQGAGIMGAIVQWLLGSSSDSGGAKGDAAATAAAAGPTAGARRAVVPGPGGTAGVLLRGSDLRDAGRAQVDVLLRQLQRAAQQTAQVRWGGLRRRCVASGVAAD